MSANKLLEKSMEDFKEQLAKRLMLWLLILITLGLLLSLYRWSEIGFQWIFVHHIAIAIVVYACYFRSIKTNVNIDFSVFLMVMATLIISGLLSFGLQSGALTFAIFSTFIIAIAWNFLSAFIYTALWTLLIVFVGYLYVNGIQEQVISPELYNKNMGSWLIVAFGSGVTIIFILVTAKQLLSYLKELINKIELQTKEIEQHAYIDHLTTFHRAHLSEPLLKQAIETAKREQSKVAVLFIDLDDFKNINDTYGHHFGDGAIRQTAKQISDVLRNMDIRCRVGGDEFMIILPAIKSKVQICEICERILDKTNAPIAIEDATISVGCSIGISVFPEDGTQFNKLSKQADEAMYEAKKSGGNTLRFYSDIKHKNKTQHTS